jgi:peptide deformylase
MSGPVIKIEGLSEIGKPSLPTVLTVKTEAKAHVGSIQKVLDEDDPMLKSISETFDFNNPRFMHPISLAQSLIMSMKAYGGVGLAAIQVGMPIRVFVVGYEEQTQVFFNPEIIAASIEKTKMKEGCISFPFCFTTVERSDKIRIRFQNQEGEWKEEDYSGYTARIIQHEYDHLDGITLRDKVGKLSWKLIKDRSKALYKKAMKDQYRKRRAT